MRQEHFFHFVVVGLIQVLFLFHFLFLSSSSSSFFLSV